MSKKVISLFAGGVLLIMLSACSGSNEESLDANNVTNDSNISDNSNMVSNGDVENTMDVISDMSDEEKAKLQVDRFVETVNNLASQTPEDDVLIVIENLLSELVLNPDQSNVSFDEEGIFTTAVGIKYKLIIDVDKVSVGEIVA
jgi:hypothetical protein